MSPYMKRNLVFILTLIGLVNIKIEKDRKQIY